MDIKEIIKKWTSVVPDKKGMPLHHILLSDDFDNLKIEIESQLKEKEAEIKELKDFANKQVETYDLMVEENAKLRAEVKELRDGKKKNKCIFMKCNKDVVYYSSKHCKDHYFE